MTQSDHSAATFGLRGQLVRTAALAGPVTVGRLGILLLITVDTAMTGHAGAQELAFYGLGMAPQIPLVLIGIGILTGTVILTAQADGAKRPRECGAVWRVAMWHAAGLGVVMLGLCQAGEWFLIQTGQSRDLAAGSGRVLAILGWGMPAMLLGIVTTLFLEGINRPVPGMIVVLLANLLNVFLNWVFIFGHLGAPEMGAVGAAFATTLVRWFMFVAALIYVLVRIDPLRYGTRGSNEYTAGVGRRLRRLGYPLGLAHGMESAAFASMTLFAGLLGPIQVAGYQVVMNLLALVFMCAVGFATAASVRVGNAIGRRDRHGVRAAGWSAVALAATLQASLVGVFLAMPEGLAAIYTNDVQVAAIALPAITIAAIAILPDGVQGVVIGALRGAGDVWPATALYLICFWGVMVPLGYFLGVHLEIGAPGLMGGVLAGTACAAAALSARFHAISLRLPLAR